MNDREYLAVHIDVDALEDLKTFIIESINPRHAVAVNEMLMELYAEIGHTEDRLVRRAAQEYGPQSIGPLAK